MVNEEEKNQIMKYIIIILISVVLLSCDDSETEILEYKWRWNIQSNPVRKCSVFNKDLLQMDYISIKIESDLGEIYNFTTYSITKDLITLHAPVEFQTEEFNDPELLRLSIKLVKYDN